MHRLSSAEQAPVSRSSFRRDENDRFGRSWAMKKQSRLEPPSTRFWRRPAVVMGNRLKWAAFTLRLDDLPEWCGHRGVVSLSGGSASHRKSPSHQRTDPVRQADHHNIELEGGSREGTHTSAPMIWSLEPVTQSRSRTSPAAQQRDRPRASNPSAAVAFSEPGESRLGWPSFL